MKRTVKEFAEYLQVSKQTVTRTIKKLDMTCEKVGNKLIIDENQQTLLERQIRGYNSQETSDSETVKNAEIIDSEDCQDAEIIDPQEVSGGLVKVTAVRSEMPLFKPRSTKITRVQIDRSEIDESTQQMRDENSELYHELLDLVETIADQRVESTKSKLMNIVEGRTLEKMLDLKENLEGMQ